MEEKRFSPISGLRASARTAPRVKATISRSLNRAIACHLRQMDHVP